MIEQSGDAVAPAPRKRRTNGARRPRVDSKAEARLTAVEQALVDLAKSVKAGGDELIANAVQRKRVDDSLVEIKKSLLDVVSAIGTESEDEYGRKVGTGVIGRLMRLEQYARGKFRFYDRWAAMATGAGAGAGALGLVLWWLLSDRLAHLLK